MSDDEILSGDANMIAPQNFNNIATVLISLIGEYLSFKEIISVRTSSRIWFTDLTKIYNTIFKEIPWRISVEYVEGIFINLPKIHSSWIKIGYFKWGSDDAIEKCDICKNSIHLNGTIKSRKCKIKFSNLNVIVWHGKGGEILKKLLKEYETVKIILDVVRNSEGEKFLAPVNVVPYNQKLDVRVINDTADIEIGELIKPIGSLENIDANRSYPRRIYTLGEENDDYLNYKYVGYKLNNLEEDTSNLCFQTLFSLYEDDKYNERSFSTEEISGGFKRRRLT